MDYLIAAVARTRLTNLGKYPDITEAALADLLPTLEDAIDGWLGWRAALTVYQETTYADRSGVITLTNSPIERIDTVTAPQISSQSSIATPLSYSWVAQSTRIGGFQAKLPVRVVYAAGYSPVPRVFSTTMFQLLNKAIEASGLSGDLSSLYEPVKDVASLNLPGGLSRTFFKGGSSGPVAGSKNSAEETQLDRLLAPLKEYRRHYILTTGTCIRIDEVPLLVAVPDAIGPGLT